MKKMLLLSAALLAVLAGPALAQRPGGAVGNGSRAPEAAPQAQQGYPDRGGRTGGGRDFNRGDRSGQFTQQGNAQAAQPNVNRGGDRSGRFGQRTDTTQSPAFNRGGQFAQQGTGQRDLNRGGNDTRNSSRGGQQDFGRNNYRGDTNGTSYRGGQQNYGRNNYASRDSFNGRNNYSNGRNNYGNQRYSQYYRSYNASRRYRVGNYYGPSGYSYRRWSYGDYLPSLYWSNRYWLNDYYAYDLTPPMPGTVWVRYGGDALLIDTYSGEVIQVAYGIFW